MLLRQVLIAHYVCCEVFHYLGSLVQAGRETILRSREHYEQARARLSSNYDAVFSRASERHLRVPVCGDLHLAAG